MTYAPTIKWTVLSGLFLALLLYFLPGNANSADSKELLNVSYYTTRELYE
jgi:hypothetical protein